MRDYFLIKKYILKKGSNLVTKNDNLIKSKIKVVVTMEHTAKGGKHKLLENCSLPLTGKKCVDMVITEMGVFEMVDNELVLTEIDPDVDLESVRAATGFKLR